MLPLFLIIFKIQKTQTKQHHQAAQNVLAKQLPAKTLELIQEWELAGKELWFALSLHEAVGRVDKCRSVENYILFLSD